MDNPPETHGINIYSESSLHRALKTWISEDGDRIEATVDGVVVDVLRDNELIEIQTGNFAGFKKKLVRLLDAHRIRLVYPLVQERWIEKYGTDGRRLSRRKSPRRGHIVQIFLELVYIKDWLLHPNLTLQVLMVQDEEIRLDDGKGSWRRRGVSIADRRLVSVVSSQTFATASDYRQTLPDNIPDAFTTADLATATRQRRRVAQKMAYCLREMGIIVPVGKRGRSILYTSSPD